MIKYNAKDKKDITRYANGLVGLSFKQIIINYNKAHQFSDSCDTNKKHKGQLGHIVEKYYFEYNINSSPHPDFQEAKLELKTAGLIKDSKNILNAKERLVISMIPHDKPIAADIENSELFEKLQAFLLVMYLYEGKNINKLDYKIKYVELVEMLSDEFKNDYEIISEDYKQIARMIINGNAHMLSEGLTRYLGACTKGQNKKSSLKPQYYNKKVPAQRRAFSLKKGYINYVIQKFIYGEEFVSKTYGKIVKNKNELLKNKLEDIVIERIKKYYGWNVNALCEKFNLINKDSKHINSQIIYRILGIKSDMAEEFAKADIVVKTIRIGVRGNIRESMSFPTINLCDLAVQDYRQSPFYYYLSEHKFLFIIFKENEKGDYILSGAMFWNMPYNDLEYIAKKEYEIYKEHIKSGVKFKLANGIVKNDLPKKKDTKIIHLRPHSSRSFYVIDGLEIGNGKLSDSDLLPDGNRMTKQCFFLNNSYVKEQIKDILEENIEE
ncbi:Sau3AI family type II restriction endonuclease [Mycoplasma sp. Z355B]|uniref:Sau3AI family type II restriction endonuclease n=1 Tax=unclassified Mycoplasma TaxID=2683645 RepID=UPI003AADE2C3